MIGPRHIIACFFLLFSFLTIQAFTYPSTAAAFTANDKRPTLFFDYGMVEDHSELLILADVPIKKHKAFLLKNPARLVIDIPGFSLLEEVVGLPVNRPELTRIRIAKHPDKIRFVFDLTESKGVTYNVVKLETGLKVVIKILNLPVITAKKTKKSKKGVANPVPPGGEILRPESFAKFFGDQRVTILFHKAPIREFFNYVADKCGMTIEVSKDISATISLRLTDVPLNHTVKQIQERYKLQLLIDGHHLQVVPAKDVQEIPNNKS
jgi:hypothetical protein